MLNRLRRLVGAEPPPVVSVLRLTGVIGLGGGLRPGLSMATLAGLIAQAFAPKEQAAVAIVVNSPGGSPVQSSLIGQRIRRLADERKVPVIAFVEDVAASGGYWLACAADEIVADPSSIVGSIGVVSAGFGFTDLLSKLGVERRVHTAGTEKAMLDPFRPENPEDVARLKTIQAEMHDTFIGWVKQRRGTKLAADDATLFNGAFWTAKSGLALGLVDALGDARTTLRARFGEKARFRVVGERRPWLARRLGLTKVAGTGALLAAEDLLAAVEERAAWARFGL